MSPEAEETDEMTCDKTIENETTPEPSHLIRVRLLPWVLSTCSFEVTTALDVGRAARVLLTNSACACVCTWRHPPPINGYAGVLKPAPP